MLGKKLPYHKGHVAWNKGLTKETDDRVLKMSKTVRSLNQLWKERGLYDKKHGHPQSESTKKKLMAVAIKRGFGGMNRKKGSIMYAGVKLNSTYELKVAQSLDDNNIAWEKPKPLLYVDCNGL